MQPFVTASLIQLLCRVTKFGWFDDERFHDVVKKSSNFLSQGTSEHYAIGLKILNQLVSEMNQPNPGLSSTHHRRVACSFRDQSLFQIFQISLTSFRHMKTDVASRLQELALFLRLKCLSFDSVGTSIDESQKSLVLFRFHHLGDQFGGFFNTSDIFLIIIQLLMHLCQRRPLECLIRLASVRHSLFANDAVCSMFWPI